jgi:predicted esterase
MLDIQAHTIAATVHGRFLVRAGPPERLLVGFHGYGETAERHLEELAKIPGIDRWTVAAVQALHPFYAGRTEQVVASWMTRLDRELAIADNITYVQSVLAWFREEPRSVLFAGFSQGVAMAFRAASHHPGAGGVLSLGGDVPPDVRQNIPPVLLARGTRDDWYTEEKFNKDLRFLRSVTEVIPCVFEGGHEWTDEYRAAAGEFLKVRC